MKKSGGGSVKAHGIGTSGPIKPGQTTSAQGRQFSHMPAASSFSTSMTRPSTKSSASQKSSGGTSWSHMPKTPSVSGGRK